MNTNFLETWNELDNLNTLCEDPEPTEKIIPVGNIDLSNSRVVASDVIDVRGEVETSTVIPFSPKPGMQPILSRIAAYVFIIKDTPDGKVFLAKKKKRRLPGGGFDKNKDNNSLVNTVIRETLEETGIKIKDVKDIDCAFWHKETNTGFEAGWVNKHITSEEDRHHGYYQRYYIARYAGEVNPEEAEEANRFDWYPISVAEKSVSINKIIYDKAKAAGYFDDNSINEEIYLKEGKQLGPVSYCVRGIGKEQSSMEILAKILKTNFIKASPADPATWPYTVPYVSLSRDLASHIGSTWKNGIILDGDKITNKYKVQPINHNSQIYFFDALAHKTLQLSSIAKFENINDPTEHFYYACIFGDSFKTNISESTYNALKKLMLLYNQELAIKAEPGAETKRGKEKYRGRTIGDVKKFSDKPVRFFDKEKQEYRSATNLLVPAKLQNKKWKCVEAYGYDAQWSGLKLTHKFLLKYRDELLVNGVDISSKEFLASVAGAKYTNEAEERIVAKIKAFVDENGIDEETTYLDGLDITNCILGIMINVIYKPIIESNFKYLHLGDPINGRPVPNKLEQNKHTIDALKFVIDYANINNLPLIYVNEITNNKEIFNQLNK